MEAYDPPPVARAGWAGFVREDQPRLAGFFETGGPRCAELVSCRVLTEIHEFPSRKLLEDLAHFRVAAHVDFFAACDGGAGGQSGIPFARCDVGGLATGDQDRHGTEGKTGEEARHGRTPCEKVKGA